METIDSFALSPTKRLIRLPEVLNMVGLSRSSVYSYIAKGRFPRAINLGERAVAWLESDVQNWISSRIAASRPVDF